MGWYARLKARFTKDPRPGSHVLLEDWGGVIDPVAYGSQAAMHALANNLHPTKTYVCKVCRNCGGADFEPGHADIPVCLCDDKLFDNER